MEILALILCVIPALVAPITISPNGNSPEIKMIGGMMVDVQKGFVPMTPKSIESTTKTNYEKSRKLNIDSTKLSLNERYRRLIPYMTFYYANDLSSTTEAYSSKDVEVEKAEIVEARMIQQNQREPKKIVYAPNRNIPRYQGNRLTQFNIASSNPTKVYYKEVPVYQTSPKVTLNYNPLTSQYNSANHGGYDHGRYVQKPIIKATSVPFAPPRKPFYNLHSNEDSANVQYYLSDKDQPPRYKLVPYEQTPPATYLPQSETVFEAKNPVAGPGLISKDQVYIRPRPIRPQYIYNNDNLQQAIVRKPVVVSENYYEKRRPPALPQPIVQSAIENGFKPIVGPIVTTDAPVVYTTISPATPIPHFESAKKPAVQVVEAPISPEITNHRQNYYQYVLEQPTYKPEEYVPSKTVSLSDLLNSLQINKSIPKPITRENVGSSIRTLLQVLNALKVMSHHNEVETPLLSTPKPFIHEQVAVEMTATPGIEVTAAPVDVELHQEPYLAPVNTPSQHLDDFPASGGTSQQFPPPVHSDDEGGTPGKPGVDYPTLSTIPPTSFDCKTQRYKGFFADPDTKCQVWHYCDLNGGQASFLCPNGTIFSQAALTCDWWFNVRCASTTQLYVLNESLYKYILPHSPKFPEDYSGPLVDKYLTLKFKEMEEQFKKNKNKQTATDKVDSDETDNASEDSEKEDTAIEDSENDNSEDVNTVSEASVVVESPGTSGNVERLQD